MRIIKTLLVLAIGSVTGYYVAGTSPEGVAQSNIDGVKSSITSAKDWATNKFSELTQSQDETQVQDGLEAQDNVLDQVQQGQYEYSQNIEFPQEIEILLDTQDQN